MDINPDNKPILKRIKPDNMENDLENEHNRLQSINNVQKEKDTNKNFEHQGNSKLMDNENEEKISVSIEDEDDTLFSFPPDDDITDMLEGVKYHGLFPTITDRYFTPYYKLNVKCPADDICILMHSNRICMLSLAPSHVALQSDKRIVKVDFKVSDKLDRILNKVSGKSKHGAQPLQANSNICIITCSNGETYIIKCCIIGKLVEVNETLVENPELLLEPPHKGGYLAIVLPNIKLLDKMKESLLTQEQYDLEMSKYRSTRNHLETLEMHSTGTSLEGV
ncbi:protein Abitram [Calliopsis andreniformis]|uniref:protein Abitram n=1 Tax=Calliopsis andreniformis TaxID=337506 RepID=UPI003FCCC2A5